MNERYLFRGKRLDNGEWVKGDLETMNYPVAPKHSVPLRGISDGYEKFEVYAKTVGQCSGLKDIKGKNIFEGDIVKWGLISNGSENQIKIAVVKQNPDIQFHTNKWKYKYGLFAYQDTQNYLEIIGNIHDNPELLKGDVEQ